ncbi:T9SS type A sorting domain-containing protein [uncultured Psychroserpens sp.]|uniref:T9SS type A sorting domain-containing protein n=1 Tax=uncultured Psychroserpens sp. TaxID=255436 RepID=UPI002601F968|nr:T9SS type A sorting domain-containing protein [uncultured Psychroserpens sp.]
MKKITFLLCLLVASVGFAQANLEDFEGGNAVWTTDNGLGGANVIVDPLDGTNMVGEIISSAAGDPWQQANLIMQNNLIDLSTSNVTVEVDVYSTQNFNMLARVDDNVFNTASSSAASATYDTSNGTWQTLTFTFDQVLDGQSLPDGEYSQINFFPNWAGSGGDAPNPIWNNGQDFIVYVDNITAVAGQALPIETCSDGIMNQDEEGVDCGGSSCPACPPEPAGPAPLPGSPDGETFSIYNGNLAGDVTNYTTNWPFAYGFGTPPVELDLDPSADVNSAWRFDTGIAGYGQGEGPVDATPYGFVSFDYWYTATNGSPGFRLEMIHNNPNVTGFVYEVGVNETTVEEAWTKVIIPMSYFTGLGFSSADFFQWKFDPLGQSVDNAGFLYIDNFLLTVDMPTVLSVEEFDASQLRVFPNPSSDSWYIESSTTINSVVLYDILGKQVVNLSTNSTEVKIDGSTLNPGMYFARIEGLNGSKTVKLIKE